MLKKALIYLGLGPDEEYEHYDDYAPTGGGPAATADDGRPVMRAVADKPPARTGSATVRPIPAAPAPSGSVRAVPATKPVAHVAPASPRGSLPESGSAVRIIESGTAKPHAITPTSFNEAQGIGDRFKMGQPVIVNLQGVERELRRRLVDFTSGLCYALGGKMDRVANQVYLLVPADVEVSSDDTRRALD